MGWILQKVVSAVYTSFRNLGTFISSRFISRPLLIFFLPPSTLLLLYTNTKTLTSLFSRLCLSLEGARRLRTRIKKEGGTANEKRNQVYSMWMSTTAVAGYAISIWSKTINGI